MTNELEKIAKKHKLSLSNEHARGWWVNPNPGNPETMARFNNSTNIGAAQGQMTGGSEASGCCESFGDENEDKFFRDLGFEFLDTDNPKNPSKTTISYINVINNLAIRIAPLKDKEKYVVFINYGYGEFSQRLTFEQIRDILLEFKDGLCDELIIARMIEIWSFNKNQIPSIKRQAKQRMIDTASELIDRFGLDCSLDLEQVADLIDENY